VKAEKRNRERQRDRERKSEHIQLLVESHSITYDIIWKLIWNHEWKWVLTEHNDRRRFCAFLCFKFRSYIIQYSMFCLSRQFIW